MGPNISLNKNDYTNTPNTKTLTQKASKKETVFILDWDDTLMLYIIYILKNTGTY